MQGTPPGPKQMAPAQRDDRDGNKAWAHCPAPCRQTGRGTALLRIERVAD